jgi:hypothetical protein
MSEDKMKEEKLKRLVNRFALAHPELSDYEILKALTAQARQFGGCINCVYSAPFDENWHRRICILGLAQSTCDSQEPIVER